MPRPAHLVFRRSALVAALLAAFADPALAAAGRVDFTAGAVTVSGADGRERPLAKGAELDNGDTVRTGQGRAQIRFTDGAYVSLQPNSEFSIKDYRYEGKTDGSETGFFALAKGAMRTVTGFIGRINRNRYRITTPTATVGIRGTGGVIQVQDDGSTLVVGTSGIWSLSNPAGSIDVPAGVSAVAPSEPTQPPQQSSEAPSAPPAPLPEGTEYTAGDEQTGEGTPLVVEEALPAAPAFTPLVSGSGYAVRIAHSQYVPTIDESQNATLTFDAAGQMTAAVLGFPLFQLEAGGSHADFGSDGILAWGRWIGSVTLRTDNTDLVNLPGNQGLHYVAGMPAATLPTTGLATYTLLGATKPTYVQPGATVAPGIFTGSLGVDFGQATVKTIGWNVSMPDRNYAINDTTMPVSGSSFSQSGIGVAGCSSSCSAFVTGFFSGATGERAGAGYHIDDSANQVLGAAAFKSP